MSAQVTRNGLVWGPAEVTLLGTLPGDRRLLRVATPHRELDIFISKTGRSVRVYEGSRELTTTTTEKEGTTDD